jgi:hypothetical protein
VGLLVGFVIGAISTFVIAVVLPSDRDDRSGRASSQADTSQAPLTASMRSFQGMYPPRALPLTETPTPNGRSLVTNRTEPAAGGFHWDEAGQVRLRQSQNHALTPSRLYIFAANSVSGFCNLQGIVLMLLSAEMRWFWPNQCPHDLERWFFDALPQAGGGKSRRDEYLRPIEPELGIKKRGSKSGMELKGLVSIIRSSELMFLAQCSELWCKWTSDAVPITNSIAAKKIRWLRKIDTSGPAALEIPLGPDEAPLNGAALPKEGCNLELTKVEIEGVSGLWWTFCFEAFGDLESAPQNLQIAAKHAASNSLPQLSGDFLSYPAWLSSIDTTSATG